MKMNEPVKDDGGPVFPMEGEIAGVRIYIPGMTLRDYFAAKALVALPNIGCGADLDVEDIAIAAYQIADAMLKAREAK